MRFPFRFKTSSKKNFTSRHRMLRTTNGEQRFLHLFHFVRTRACLTNTHTYIRTFTHNNIVTKVRYFSIQIVTLRFFRCSTHRRHLCRQHHQHDGGRDVRSARTFHFALGGRESAVRLRHRSNDTRRTVRLRRRFRVFILVRPRRGKRSIDR